MSVVRQFPSTQASTFADLSSMTREELVERYQAFISPLLDEEVMQARSVIVRKYRSGNGVAPDTELYRWYKAEDWTDDGIYLGKEPLPRDAAAARAKERQTDEKTKRLAIAKQMLESVEVKLGVKPPSQPALNKPINTEDQAKFDKAAYQREYMRKRRESSKKDPGVM